MSVKVMSWSCWDKARIASRRHASTRHSQHMLAPEAACHPTTSPKKQHIIQLRPHSYGTDLPVPVPFRFNGSNDPMNFTNQPLKSMGAGASLWHINYTKNFEKTKDTLGLM
jgi:hypothetical protein